MSSIRRQVETLGTSLEKEVQEPNLRVVEIGVRNFKSINEAVINLTKGVTVLAGANNTGKTNVLEALAFLSKALVREADGTPYAPHYPPYPDGLDLIWARDPSRRLEYWVKILYECPMDARGKRRISGEAVFSFSFAYEPSLKTLVPIEVSLKYLDGYEILVNNEGITIRLHTRSGGAQQAFHKIEVPLNYRSILLSLRGLPAVSRVRVTQQKDHIRVDYDLHLSMTSLMAIVGKLEETRIVRSLEKIRLNVGKEQPIPVSLSIRNRNVRLTRKKKVEKCLYHIAPIFLGIYILEWLSNVVFIKYIDRAALTSPHPPSDNSYLSEDASNLPEVLERYRSATGQMPPTVEYLLREEFPGFKVWTSISENWLITLNARENRITIPAVSMPSGLLKTITIATAVDLKPSLLLIDEIENSLHPRLLKRIMDVLQTSGSPVIVATHSPTVIDMVDTDRIIIVSREKGGTILRKVANRRSLIKTLEEQGLSIGEYVSYVETWKD